ncbi:iron-siderophore ABC transporter substrate-binding protein [Pseudanabaena sp. UWO310]|uniref:iron-siderophore ABC transporter substrate-binding protein n=1 Tax=Pseudanabaena sp. UWO310 TaxID=2480795 RepID=UPI001157CCCC|nr:iron-siderophore ABC transporter substrate-binding protein [Pseudanabaena sp. UWO310]TYQ29831.1 iron-siderophore ABC transporter substrate-binding protein [Pseudanabaena sp. UWO310]
MKIINSVRSIAVAIVIILAIVACQGQPYQPDTRNTAAVSPRNDCRDVEHAMGVTKVCGQPQRIVVLGPYLLEPLLALDMQPIAFADNANFHQGDYTNPSKQIPYLGTRIANPIANVGVAYAPSIEAILKVQPDLILGLDINNKRQYPILSNIAPTIILKWTDPEINLKEIAQAINRSPQAEQLIANTKQEIAAARQAFEPIVKTDPKMLLLISSELREMTLGTKRHGLCTALLQDLGFQLVYPPKQEEALAPISLETLPQLNQADRVLLLGNNFSNPNQFKRASSFEESQLANLKQAWSKNAIAQSLKASKAGKVYFVPTYLCLGLPGTIGTHLYLDELKKQILSS